MSLVRKMIIVSYLWLHLSKIKVLLKYKQKEKKNILFGQQNYVEIKTKEKQFITTREFMIRMLMHCSTHFAGVHHFNIINGPLTDGLMF